MLLIQSLPGALIKVDHEDRNGTFDDPKHLADREGVELALYSVGLVIGELVLEDFLSPVLILISLNKQQVNFIEHYM